MFILIFTKLLLNSIELNMEIFKSVYTVSQILIHKKSSQYYAI